MKRMKLVRWGCKYFLFLFLFLLPAQAQAEEYCTAWWAAWLDWYRCLDCGLGDGWTFTKTYTPGLPNDLGSHDTPWFKQEEKGSTYYVAYFSSSPQKIVPSPWPNESWPMIYSYEVFMISVSYPKGSMPDYPGIEISNYWNDVFLGWGLANIQCDGDGDPPPPPDDDPPPPDDDPPPPCPDLNIHVTGSVLPVRRGVVRVDADWCK